jgi:hypothetical protein
MADWAGIARRKHQNAQAELARMVNRHAVSVPIGDSDATAPGYLQISRTFSCIPDAQYPWDRDIIRDLRAFEPDIMPAICRTTLQYSNYYDHGRLGEPVTLVRHVLARAIRDPISAVHNYPVEMPSSPVPGLLIPGRRLDQCTPNYIEWELYDRNIRPYGHDFPGAYEAFDWRAFYRFADGWSRLQEAREAARREEKAGETKAVGAAAGLISQERQTVSRREARRKDDGAYIDRDLSAYYSVEPSDVEWKEAYLGEPKRPTPPVSVVVPSLKESAV